LLIQFDFVYVCAWYGSRISGGTLLASEPGAMLIAD
jgi:hypothetical protein